MNKYLTIGEVSKLKNITIESLRHYDRIGLLKPIYTNPKTSYRYYDAHQLSHIDIINYCKKINVPLKDIKAIFEKADNEEFKKFIDIQKQGITKEIEELQNSLSMITKLQTNLEKAKKYTDNYDVYYRDIPERNIVYLSFSGDNKSEDSLLAYSTLEKYIHDYNLINLYNGGFIYGVQDYTTLQTKAIFESIKDKNHGSYPFKTTILKGKFLCLNYKLKHRDIAIEKLLKTLFDLGKDLSKVHIIDTYLISDFFDVNESRYEFQVYIGH